MDPSYQNLVRTICSNLDELKRFRQLLVQTVMATDIADAELRAARNQRWDKAFATKIPMPDSSGGEEEESDADRNRKATIVLEHLLQASDIAHTMQHWEVFKKWVSNAGVDSRRDRMPTSKSGSPVGFDSLTFCRMKNCSEKCTSHTCMGVRTRTLVIFGILGKSGFSSFTL